MFPARYQRSLSEDFIARVLESIEDDSASLLDVGAGRTPLIPPARRPAGIEYVGIDISQNELELAGDDYDDSIVADICVRQDGLDGRFDVACSWQVLEHIRPLSACADNVHAYLKPGGVFISQLSGGLAVFALLNRAIPPRLSKWLLLRLLGRDPETVFPAYYDKCTKSGLETTFENWSNVEVIPIWLGAGYWRFAPPLQRLYLRYEAWAIRNKKDDWAPYYQVIATK